MNTPSRGLAALCCACLAATLGAGKAENPLDRMAPVPANEPIPLVDFFRPTVFRHPQINDAGTLFAAMVTAGADREELLVYDFATAKFDRLHGVGKKDIYDFDWLDDDRLIFALSSDKRYREGLYVASARDLSDTHLVDLDNVSLVVARPEAKRMQPLVWIKHSAYRQGRDGGLLQIDASVEVRNPFVEHAYFDPSSLSYGTTAHVIRSFPAPKESMVMWYAGGVNGELAHAYVQVAGKQTMLRWTGQGWSPCPVDMDSVDVISSETPERAVVLGPRQEDKPRALQTMDVSDGRPGEVIWQDNAYDPTDCQLYRHPVSKAIIGVRLDRMVAETVWFDERYRVIQSAIEKLLPGQVVQILGSDRAEKRFFIGAFSDRQPYTYYAVDLEKRSLGLIKCQRPWIDAQRMQPTGIIQYKTRDGKTLDGYLTLPLGASKTNPAPLVVLPHGGPWVRDSWGFDPEVQFLASRGYAVFQPNYRGSLGTQWRFPEGDNYEFRKMHDDVTDGVRWVLKSSRLDPDRVAIMGWSFGGYLALSGAVHDGSLYRCAVALSGVYDWEQVMREARNEEMVRGRYEFLRRHLGDPKTNKDRYDAISPLRHVENVKIPMFVGHGSGDFIADINEAKRLVAELKKYNVPVVTRFESGEGHGMQQMKNRIEMYAEIEKFLAEKLAPRAHPPAAPVAATP